MAFLGCSGQSTSINEAKEQVFVDLDRTRTLEMVFSHYAYYTDHQWSATTDKQGRSVVTMTGTIQWSGKSCRVSDDTASGAELRPCAVTGTETFVFAQSALKADPTFGLLSVAGDVRATDGTKSRSAVVRSDRLQPSTYLESKYRGTAYFPGVMFLEGP
jgi:hypothetical protein